MTKIKNIVKRDGRTVPYNAEKISMAIQKACAASSMEKQVDIIKLTCEVTESLICKNILEPSVEQVQDEVENTLLRNNFSDVAKNYILYRFNRTQIRELNTTLMQSYKAIVFDNNSELKKENANINGNTPMGTMLKFGSEGAKEFAHKYLLSKEASEAHMSGDIHIHDLDFYMSGTTTCTQIDLIKLFENGFSTGHGFLREPNSIMSYAALAAIAIQANQNDQHGGQSIPNFDYAMAEGVKKSYKKLFKEFLFNTFEDIYNIQVDLKCFNKMINEVRYNCCIKDFDRALQLFLSKHQMVDSETVNHCIRIARKRANMRIVKETHQAMESFIHNLNTMHSRAGAQVPFSSINYGTDISEEGRLVIRELLNVTQEGLGNGETPIFPIQIFKIKNGVNYHKNDVNYDLFQLAMKTSAKRLFPNFSFADAPFNAQYYKEGHPETEISYMGCRTRVIGNEYDKNNEVVYGRGNNSFTSINLPRIGIRNKGNWDGFFEELDNKMELISRQLLARMEFQGNMKVENFPFLMGQGNWINSSYLKQNDVLNEVLKHGSLSIGFIGLAETMKVMTKKHHAEDGESRKLAFEIIKHMRIWLDNKAKETGLNFSLIATPAEGLSGRFVKIDKQKFGIIKGVTDRNYYTNSFHVPVYYPITAFEKIKIEAPYHELTNAGHISYVELDGNILNNIGTFEKIIRCMYENGIGYGSINHPIDRDSICGYNGVIGDNCPKCGRDEKDVPFERIRRITGYLVGTIDRWNSGKKEEEKDRIKHKLADNNIGKN